MLNCFYSVWLFVTLWTIACKAPLSMWFFRQELWRGLPSSKKRLSSGHLLSRVRLFATPWIAAFQASLSIINSRSLPKLKSIESVMPSKHLILCCPLLLLPSIFPSISVFSNESALCIRWPKYWSFSFRINPSNEYLGMISFQSKGLDKTELKFYF